MMTLFCADSGMRRKNCRKEKQDIQNGKTKSNSRKKGNIKRKIAYALLFIMLAVFSAALIARPEVYIERCAEGIALWAQCVLPSLFPFMVVCALLVNTGLTAKISSPLSRACAAVKLPPCAAACFVMGASSGYPAGSRTIYMLYSSGVTDKQGARKLAALCTTSGPLFMIGTVGANMFGDGAVGAKLFAAHIISVAATALVMSATGKPCNGELPELKKSRNVLEESFYGAVTAALTAGAFIAFFYTAAQVLQDLYILYPVEWLLSRVFDEKTAEAVTAGLIEMTSGCAMLAAGESTYALPLAGFIITFGGACVLSQQLCYLTKARISPAKFVAVKFIQGTLCFAILLIPL